MTAPSLLSRTSSFRSLLLGALLVAASASAETGGTVVLGGTVASAASITSVTTAGAGTLAMGGQGVTIGEQIVLVADIDLNTNNVGGLTLTVDPGTGTLSNGVGSVEFKVLTMANGIAPLSADFELTGVADVYNSATVGLVPVDLFIAYTPGNVLDPGIYSGNITLTVVDNA